jgi:hypothetical protein
MLDFPGCAGVKVWSNVELDLLLQLEYYIGSNSSTAVGQKGEPWRHLPLPVVL